MSTIIDRMYGLRLCMKSVASKTSTEFISAGGVCLGPGDCGTAARYQLNKLGKSWFLTEAEAQKALEEKMK